MATRPACPERRGTSAHALDRAGSPGPLTSRLSHAIQQVAQRHHIEYVDVTGWLPQGRHLLAGDGAHLTEQGERRVAARVQRALEQLGLIKPAGQPTG